MCFSKAILSYNIMCFSLHPMAYNEFLSDSLTIVKVSVGGVSAFSDGPFSAYVSSGSTLLLSFRRSVLGSTTAFLLYHISWD